MLVVGPKADLDATVSELPSLLRPGDVLVVNDAKVIPAQLFGWRRRGDAVARIDVTCTNAKAPRIGGPSCVPPRS